MNMMLMMTIPPHEEGRVKEDADEMSEKIVERPAFEEGPVSALKWVTPCIGP